MTQNCINSSNPVLQVVSNTLLTIASQTTVMPSDNSIPQNTEGDEVLTVTITPQLSTSTLEIIFTAGSANPGTPAIFTLALFQDSTGNALAAKSLLCGSSSRRIPAFLKHVMTSGTTSSTTFKIRCGPSSAGTTRINGTSGGTQQFGGVCQTILTVTEYRS